MPCLAFVNSWFTAPPYIRSRCFARGSEVVFYYIYFFIFIDYINIIQYNFIVGRGDNIYSSTGISA